MHTSDSNQVSQAREVPKHVLRTDNAYRNRRAAGYSIAAAVAVVAWLRPAWLGISKPYYWQLAVPLCVFMLIDWYAVFQDRRKYSKRMGAEPHQ